MIKTCRDCGTPEPDRGGFTDYYEAGASTPEYSLCRDCDLGARLKTGRVSTGLYMAATMEYSDIRRERGIRTKHHEALCNVARAMRAVEMEVRTFQDRVWTAGLQGYYRKAEKRGHKLVDVERGVDLLLWGSAGRVLATCNLTQDLPEDPGSKGDSITLIGTDDSSPNVGIQGIDATVHSALCILKRVCLSWKTGLRPKPDEKVGMF